MSLPALPAGTPEDTDDIRWQLETAGAMWKKGDLREALRWLRRAAEAASEAGLDMRAVELARSAAELRTQLDVPATIPPPPMASPPNDGGAAPKSLGGTVVIPPSNLPDEGAWASPGDTTEPHSMPAAESAPPPPHAAFAAAPEAPPAPPVQQTPSRPPMGTAPGIAPSAAAASVPAGVDTHQAIRVAITSAKSGLVLARPLAPGEVRKAGEKEALLVTLEPGVDLLGR